MFKPISIKSVRVLAILVEQMIAVLLSGQGCRGTHFSMPRNKQALACSIRWLWWMRIASHGVERPTPESIVDDLVSVRESCKEGAVVRIPASLVS